MQIFESVLEFKGSSALCVCKGSELDFCTIWKEGSSFLLFVSDLILPGLGPELGNDLTFSSSEGRLGHPLYFILHTRCKHIGPFELAAGPSLEIRSLSIVSLLILTNIFFVASTRA